MSFLFVKIYYGPCHTFDTYIHKPHLLAGLRDRLQKVGFRVCLVPVSFANYCMIEMCGHEVRLLCNHCILQFNKNPCSLNGCRVFRCNLKHLKFNTSYERDTVAQRAIEAVLTSAVKFRRGRACLWFWTLLNHQMFRRNKYEPKDYWAKDVDLIPFPTCTECMDCCNILIKEEQKPEVAKPET